MLSQSQASTKTDKLTESFNLWKQKKDPVYLEQTLQALKPTISSAITSFAKTDSPDIRLKAQNLAIKALKTYDPSKGASLKSHVMLQLQPLSRYALQSRGIIGLSPTQIQMVSALKKEIADFEDKFGREPTDTELADRMGLSLKRINKIRALARPQTSFEQLSEGEQEAPPIFQSDKEREWAEFVYFESDPIDKKIMEWKLGWNNQPILKNYEIAKRLNITPSAVTQRLIKIQRKLSKLYE